MKGTIKHGVVFPENEKYLKSDKGGRGGVKFDQEKPQHSLIPPEALDGVARVFTMGAAKYGSRNWESGIAYGRVFSACMRHLWAWWGGESLDPESGLSHLHHAACNIMMLQAHECRGLTEFDDRLPKEKT